MIIHQDWLVRNAARRYPIDELASSEDDKGVRLPEDLIVDANIWAPKYIYSLTPTRTLTSIYISSFSSSAGLVSLTLLGSAKVIVDKFGNVSDEPEIFVPLGVVTVSRPVVPYNNYPIKAMLDGVIGWVAFGPGVERTNEYHLFSKPNQSMLVPRAFNVYDSAPVQGIKLQGGTSVLTGDVTIRGTGVVTAYPRDLTLAGGGTARGIVLEMENKEETLSAYAGPCKGRPESGTCSRSPITTIAGVAPDCNGNIAIQVQGMTIRWLADNTGFCVDSSVGLSGTCDQTNNLPYADGTLKSDIAYVTPCDRSTPYHMVVNDSVLDQTGGGFVPQSGSWYVEGGTVKHLVGVGQSTVSMIGPCFPACPFTAAGHTRTFATTMLLPSYMQGGLYLMQQGVRWLELRSDGLYKAALYMSPSEYIRIAGGGLSAALSFDGTAGHVNGYTFAASDPWWQPGGRCGAWIRAQAGHGGDFCEILTFSVIDT